MDFNIKLGGPESIKTDAIVVGVYANGELSEAAAAIDSASDGALKAAVKAGDITGKSGSCLMFRKLAGVNAVRVLVVGLGKKHELNEKAFGDAVRAGARNAGGAKDIMFALSDWSVPDRDSKWQAMQLVMLARETIFRVDELKSEKKDDKQAPAKVALLLNARDAETERGLAQGSAIANGVELTKRLGNLPSNICTPSFLAEQARKMAKEFKLEVEVLEQKQMETLKMGSLLSVSRGSAEPPRLIVLKYHGAGKKAPIALVGKGITFDTGGISIKSAASMDEMKYDMCGAASVLGTFRAIAELKPAINLVGVIAACENMPSGTATKPGDIVTSMSGLTIEVLNTDAEGRLVLADALTYVERFKPESVVDIATLTGACITALGNINAGLFSADEELVDELLAASRSAADAIWRMPLGEDYLDQMKSNFADIANIGSPSNAGAVTAACFLSRFSKAYRWAHLDIAGVAWKGGAAKGATGRPVPLLTQFVLARAS